MGSQRSRRPMDMSRSLKMRKDKASSEFEMHKRIYWQASYANLIVDKERGKEKKVPLKVLNMKFMVRESTKEKYSIMKLAFIYLIISTFFPALHVVMFTIVMLQRVTFYATLSPEEQEQEQGSKFGFLRSFAALVATITVVSFLRLPRGP
ncbi:hypothetical protein GUITHDRAFT_115715 [Guillardia theta CCMP2712]|uniref:Uncharacterized protein n=2 Tax=Guillardia theta TaxID=55529 RepID=L1IPH6_GUITC|nr:hypothetical protein GUITHDRAFT_115715 [Guillardia theta CCMP2712]EKX38168.1 hypothetical protein GUITHDRAFT_115715 [Guillardia theta CCMP2712]|eukprot:XP_005825148.1 hypothetical protein GUITHDRAFT_115715 [Guillardia theta CCMP2712]